MGVEKSVISVIAIYAAKYTRMSFIMMPFQNPSEHYNIVLGINYGADKVQLGYKYTLICYFNI